MTGLYAHLEGGATSVCRCWAVTRGDGRVYGFTDHDTDLAFENVAFRANTGMTARALQQTTGLAVDNTEAYGALSDEALSEAEILAGRFDGAVVRAWLVNWQDVAERLMQFKGTIGEIRRSGGSFQAELRGLTEALNQPQGRVYQKPCAAVLGDAACGFDLRAPGYAAEVAAEGVADGRTFTFGALPGFEPRWFERGRFVVTSGAASGLVGIVKTDRGTAAGRVIELWQALGAVVLPGDGLRIEAGCDKRVETCRLKFANFVNYRGFPDIPGEDWLMAYPARSGTNDGGSLSA